MNADDRKGRARKSHAGAPSGSERLSGVSPRPPRAAERAASLRRLRLDEGEANASFERIARLLAQLLRVRMACVTLFDGETRRFHGRVGFESAEAPSEGSLCARTLCSSEPFVVEDVAKIADPLAVGTSVPAGARFYAGVAVRDERGVPIGTLAAFDSEPRRIGRPGIELLASLGEMVEDAIRLAASEARVRQEVALREDAARKHERLVSMMPGALYNYERRPDGSARIAYVSDGVSAMLGYTPEEFASLTERGIVRVHEEDVEAFVESIEISARDLTPWHWEGRLLAKDDTPRWIQGDSRPELGADGVIRWAGILTDITALKRHEDEIREANARLEERVKDRTEELEEAQSEILMRLGRAAEVRDDDTGAHIARVSRYCEILARGLGLAEEEVDVIVRAAPMHDIGKISVPDAILLKPGKLNPEEIARMRCHAEQGARMLSGGSNELVRTAELIARTHHERWDGTGYPQGLAGEEIPLAGRIVAIADVFDALTSERPYKRAWSVDEAATEIANSAGTHFDPVLVAIFLEHLNEFAGVARLLADRPEETTGAPVLRLAA